MRGRFVVVDAMARVGDEQLDGVPTPRRTARRRGGGASCAAAHRLLGVQEEVEQRLLQLAAVAERPAAAPARSRRRARRVQAELVGAQRQHAVHQVGDVLRRALGGLPARERQQVADDPRRPLGLLGDAPQIARELRRRPQRVRPRRRRAVPPASSCA